MASYFNILLNFYNFYGDFCVMGELFCNIQAFQTDAGKASKYMRRYRELWVYSCLF